MLSHVEIAYDAAVVAADYADSSDDPRDVLRARAVVRVAAAAWLSAAWDSHHAAWNAVINASYEEDTRALAYARAEARSRAATAQGEHILWPSASPTSYAAASDASAAESAWLDAHDAFMAAAASLDDATALVRRAVVADRIAAASWRIAVVNAGVDLATAVDPASVVMPV